MSKTFYGIFHLHEKNGRTLILLRAIASFHIVSKLLSTNYYSKVFNRRYKTLSTNFTGQSPSWKTNRSSTSQGIPCILWNPKDYDRIYKRPPPVPILSQISPVNVIQFHFLKIRFNIIVLFAPASSKWSVSLRFPHKNPVRTPTVSSTFHFPHLSQRNVEARLRNHCYRGKEISIIFFRACARM